MSISQPPRLAIGSFLAILATLAGCEKSLEEKMTPAMQVVLDKHAERLAPVMKLVPATLEPKKCEGSLPKITSDVPFVSREIADKLATKSVKPLSLSYRDPPFFVGAYYTILTGGWTRGEGTFNDAMRSVEDMTLLGVIVPTKYEPPKVSGRVVEEYAHFEGWFVLLDLATPRVLVQAPIEADNDDMIMVSENDPVAPQLVTNLEGNIVDEIDKAMDTACPSLVLGAKRAQERKKEMDEAAAREAADAAAAKKRDDALKAKFDKIDADHAADRKAFEAELEKEQAKIDAAFTQKREKSGVPDEKKGLVAP